MAMAVGLGGFAVEKAAAQNAGTPPTWAAPFQRGLVGAHPFGISAGDVDADGFPEVAVVESMIDIVTNIDRVSGPAVINIFRNKTTWNPPDAGFEQIADWQLELPEPLIPRYVELIDVDNEGHADVVVTVGEPENNNLFGYNCGVYVFRFNEGAGQFFDPEYYPSSIPLGRHRVADMNGDQLLDIVCAVDFHANGRAFDNTVRVYYQDCAHPGLFLPEQMQAVLNETGATVPCAVGDFHRQTGVTGGINDVVTWDMQLLSNNGNNPACQNAAYTGHTTAYCTDPWDTYDMVAAKLRLITLIGGTRFDDVATVSWNQEHVRIFKSQGGTTFTHTCTPGVDLYAIDPTFSICNSPRTAPFPLVIPSGISAGLLNAGPRMDLAVTSCDGAVAILLGNGNGTYVFDNGNPAYFVRVDPQPPGPDFIENHQVLIVDLNLDGKGDLVTSNHSAFANSISVVLNTTP
ncbi:MAG: hypothetical protein JNL50_07465 [Phycisphaerae bacterium]|nr:hypothetical protein [Phycisphaerae bacterium]